MAYNERTVKILSPDDTRTFKETGREEVHTVEAYEKRVHGENIEPTRQFSTNSYTERRTYGRDENGEVVVKIDKNPRDPVRPVSPVRPFGKSPTPDSPGEHILRPIPNFETIPLQIPRVETRNSNKHDTLSPGSIQWHDQVSPHSGASPHHSPRSGRSSGFGSSPQSVYSGDQPIAANVPMKKITRKSRLVSIYDGQPVTDYVEKVYFETADDQSGYSRPNSRYSTQNSAAAYKNSGVVLNKGRYERFIPIQRESSEHRDQYRGHREHGESSEHRDQYRGHRENFERREHGESPEFRGHRDNTVHKLHRQPEWNSRSRYDHSDTEDSGALIMENPLFSNYRSSPN